MSSPTVHSARLGADLFLGKTAAQPLSGDHVAMSDLLAALPAGSLPSIPEHFGTAYDFTSDSSADAAAGSWAILGNGPDDSVVKGFQGCGDCFPSGTRILMADGSTKAIEDVHTLDRVVSAEGNACQVSATRVITHIGDLLSLRLWGHKHLRCTPDHRVLTRRGWVAATSLKIGDWLCQPRWRPEERKTITVSDYLTVERRIRQKGTRRWSDGSVSVLTALPETIELTEGFGRLVGLFLAEGSTNQNVVRFSFGLHELDTLVAECVSLLESELGVHGRVSLASAKRNVAEVVVCGKHWRMFWEALCAKGAGYKRLHPDLHAGPDGFRENVLNGWLAGDGHRRRRAHAGCTISHAMALDMMQIGLSLGEQPTIKCEQREARQDRWIVTFRPGDAKCQESNESGACWRRVEGVEREEFVGHVFDITVDDDHSFVAETIAVHNCDWAATAHVLMQAADNAGRPIPPFSGLTVVDQYAAYSGYDIKTGANDNGTDMQESIKWCQTKGFYDDNGTVYQFGKSVSLTPGDINELWAATYLFEDTKIGITVTTAQMDQFDASSHPVWDYVAGSPQEGGHAIPPMGVSGLISWGTRVGYTPALIEHQMDEGFGFCLPERYAQVTGETVEGYTEMDLEKFVVILAAQKAG